jgi:hypothetical protein
MQHFLSHSLTFSLTLSLSLHSLSLSLFLSPSLFLSQRVQQYLLANGIAVVVVNPWAQDQWDYPHSLWDTGYDKVGIVHVVRVVRVVYSV